MINITENARDDLVIMHYYVRTTSKLINGEIRHLIITACGHRFNEINTTRNATAVTCRACLHTVRMGQIVKY